MPNFLCTLYYEYVALLLLTVTLKTDANFNLYLRHSEVKRILGLTAELFYVREGVVNDYAMSWTVPIPEDIHELYFTWEAVTKKPVLYNIAITKNDTTEVQEALGVPTEVHEALGLPTVNISLTGIVPIHPETFRLELPCSGRVSGEVAVTLNINVTSPRPRQPPIVLYFKRNKICRKGISIETFEPHKDTHSEESDDDMTLPIIYYIIATIAGISLVFIIIAVVAYAKRRRNEGKREADCSFYTSVYLGSDMTNGKARPITASSTLLRVPTPHKNPYTHPSSLTLNSYASLRKISTITPSSTTQPHCLHSIAPRGTAFVYHSRDGTTVDGSCDDSVNIATIDGGGAGLSNSSITKSEVLVDPNAAELQERFKQINIERQRVRLTSVLQEGSFGRLYRGCVQRDRPEQDQQVVIKTVTETAPSDAVTSLCNDGTQLFNLYHVNVLTMVGISFADNSPPFIIFPFNNFNNLKLYLQQHRGGHLRAAELVELAVQAAQGVAFLHSAGVLHGDIGARNCVVSEKLQLRITDSALAKDLFPTDYESSDLELPRPIKWMSYEAITEGITSPGSDVWSYGVLLWELTTLAQHPYVEVASCEMAEYLRDGYRLAQPLNCPDDLYKVMAYCWAIQPLDRPRATLILDYLAAFHRQLDDFI